MLDSTFYERKLFVRYQNVLGFNWCYSNLECGFCFDFIWRNSAKPLKTNEWRAFFFGGNGNSTKIWHLKWQTLQNIRLGRMNSSPNLASKIFRTDGIGFDCHVLVQWATACTSFTPKSCKLNSNYFHHLMPQFSTLWLSAWQIRNSERVQIESWIENKQKTHILRQNFNWNIEFYRKPRFAKIFHTFSEHHSFYRQPTINIDNQLTHILRLPILTCNTENINKRHLRQSNRYWLQISCAQTGKRLRQIAAHVKKE